MHGSESVKPGDGLRCIPASQLCSAADGLLGARNVSARCQICVACSAAMLLPLSTAVSWSSLLLRVIAVGDGVCGILLYALHLQGHCGRASRAGLFMIVLQCSRAASRLIFHSRA